MSNFVPELSEPANLRDLGGIITEHGVVAPKFAIRSDDLSTVTPEYADELVRNGLVTVIDLRSIDEIMATGRGPLQERAVTYHHVPFMQTIGSVDMPNTAPGQIPKMAEMYPMIFERAAKQIVTALAVIAYAPGAVAFHCAAGRDRTGVLAAALLLALGASDEAIVSDYDKTHANMTEVGQRMSVNLGAVMQKHGYNLNAAARAARAQEIDDRAMEVTLGVLRERYVDPLAPLRAAGLSDGLVTQLRSRAGV